MSTFLSTLISQLSTCLDDSTKSTGRPIRSSTLRQILTSAEEFARAWDGAAQSEKQLQIYILRSGEIKVQCDGSPVSVSQVSGRPTSETEREVWCEELEEAVNTFRRGLRAPGRTSSPIHSDVGEERVLLKLVLLIPARLECSVQVQ